MSVIGWILTAFPNPGKSRLVVIEGTKGQASPKSVAPLERRHFVDLNYLFHRQQVERIRSEAARSEEARTAHEELAKRYEERIEALTADEFHFLTKD